MKNLFKGLLVLLVTLVVSCNSGHYQDDYRVIRGPQGQEMVVVQDDNGGSFLMDYLTFQALMNQGGYNSVLNQYRSNSGLYPMYNRNVYSNWNTVRNVPRNQFNYYHEEPTYTEPTTIVTRESNRNYTPTYSKPSNSSFRSNKTSTYSNPSSSFKSSSSSNSYSKPSSSFRSNTSSSYSKPSSSSSFKSSSSSSKPSSSSSFRSSSSSSKSKSSF